MPITFLDEQPSVAPQSSGRVTFLDGSPTSKVKFLDGPGREPTVEELKNLRDTRYQLSQGEFRRVYDADQARPLTDKVAAGAGAAAGAVGSLLGELGHRALKAVTPDGPSQYPATDPRSMNAPQATLLEGAGRAVYDLGRMVTRGGIKTLDALAPTGNDPAAAAHARYLRNIAEDTERMKMAEGAAAPLISPSGTPVGVDPSTSELFSYVFDPAPAAVGAHMVRRAGQAVSTKIAERAGQKAAEKALGSVAAGASRVFEVAKMPANKAANALESTLPGTGAAEAAKASIGAATTPITATAKAVEKGAGAAQQFARTDGKGQFSRLRQLSMSETAPAWVRAASRNLDRLGVEDAVVFGGAVARSGAVGGTVAGAIAAPGVESPEELGAAVGTGFTLGSLTHIALSPLVTDIQRRAAEDYDLARWYSRKSDAEKSTLDKANLPRHVAISLMDVEAIANGVLDPNANVQFLVLGEADYNASPLIKGVGEGTRGVSVVAGAKPTIVFNANRVTDGTAYHELGHILVNSPEIFDLGGMMTRLFGIHDAQGKQLRPGIFPEGEFARRGEQYFQKFDPAAQQVLLAERNAYLTDPNSPAGQVWARRIAGEVMAELFANLGRSTPGGVLKSAHSLPRQIVDKMLLSERPLAQKAGEFVDKHVFNPQRTGSDILPDLQNTPQIDAALRQSIRNKANLSEAPTFDTKRMEEEMLSFNPREVLKAGGEELMKKFADNDNFEKTPDGSVARGAGNSPILRSEQTIKKVQKQRAEAMLEALASSPDANAGDPALVKPEINPKNGQPDFTKWSGPKFSDAQLANFDNLPGNVLTPSQKTKIRELNSGPGQVFEIDYNAATKKGRYSSSISKTIRKAALLNLNISKAGNFFATFLDLTAFNRKLADWNNTPSKKRAFKDFNDSPEFFVQKVYEALANHQKGVPARTDLDSDPAKAKRMADRINDFINIRDIASESNNPDRISGTSDKDKLIRSLRFDRMNGVKRTQDRFDIDYNLQKANFSPDVSENPNFKKWFGKSKFVDESGKPLVMYRGDDLPFYEFDPGKTRENGFFFTPDKDVANIYGRGESQGYYIKAEKVLDLTQDTRETRQWVRKWAEAFDDWTDRQSGEPVDPFDVLESGQMFDYEGTWSSERWLDIQQTAREDGYDAVILPDYDSQKGVFPSVVVFEPTHIKSVDNRGTFDPVNNDVRFSPDEAPMFHFVEQYDEALLGIVNQFKQSKKGQHYRWPAVNADDLANVWLEYGKRGALSEASVTKLEKLKAQTLLNIARLRVTTELMGHSQLNPAEVLENAGFDFTEKQIERLGDFLTTKQGSYMLSDYGLPKVEKLYDPLFNAKTPDEIISVMDRILNVVHQRSDFAEFFVQGGTKTLDRIASQGGYKTPEDGSRNFSPDIVNIDEVRNMPAADFATQARAWKGGVTGQAIQIGKTATPEVAAKLAEYQSEASARAKQARAAGDMQTAMTEALRGQFFREAGEAYKASQGEEGLSIRPQDLERQFSPEGEKEANRELQGSRSKGSAKWVKEPSFDNAFEFKDSDGRVLGAALQQTPQAGGAFVARLGTDPTGQSKWNKFNSMEEAQNWVASHFPKVDAAETARKLDRESGQYSQLEKVINEKVQGQSIPAAQLAAMLRNPQSGVKVEEIKWTGLDDFLKGKERVSKQELLDFVRANRLQIEEKRLGEPMKVEETTNLAGKTWKEYPNRQIADTGVVRNLWELEADNGDVVARIYGSLDGTWFDASYNTGDGWNHMGRYTTFELAKQEAEANTRNLTQTDEREVNPHGVEGPSKYESYKSPGGENYREILFRFPDSTQVEDGPTAHWQDSRVFAHTRVQDYVDQGERPKFPQKAYQDALDRNDLDAAQKFLDDNREAETESKTLLIDEIQSDWHQKGRKEGYRREDPPEKKLLEDQAATAHRMEGEFLQTLTDLTEQHRVLEQKLIQEVAEKWGKAGGGFIEPHDFKTLAVTRELNHVYENPELKEISLEKYRVQEKLRQIREQRDGLLRRIGTFTDARVSEAPFAKTWHEFVFKRMLRDAVEKGYDAIEWPVGQEIAKRFNLFENIDTLYYKASSKNKDGEKSWVIKPDDGDEIFVADKDLADYVGENVAEQIRKNEGEDSESVDFQFNDHLDSDDPLVERSEYVYEANDGRRAVLIEESYYRDAEARDDGDEPYTRSYEVAIEGRNGRVEAEDSFGSYSYAESWAQRQFGEGFSKLTGKDITLESDESRGMKSFYDNMLPSFVNKYVKKWGASVKDTVRGKPSESWVKGDEDTLVYAINDKLVARIQREVKNGTEYFQVHEVDEDGDNGSYWGYGLTLDEGKAIVNKHTRSTPRGGFSVHRVEITDAMRSEIKTKGQTLFSPDVPKSPEFKRWFGDSKVVDETGKPKVVYHGAGRIDRVGSKMIKGRSTSGPMPYFTEDADIASSYAQNKIDNSLDDINIQVNVRLPGEKKPIKLEQMWYRLSREEQEKIIRDLPRVQEKMDTSEGWERGTGEYVIDQGLMDRQGWEYEVRRQRGDWLKAAYEIWVHSGSIFGNEEAFEKVLKTVGLDAVVEDPQEPRSGVLAAYLSIKNPLDVSNIPEKVVTTLEAQARRVRRKPAAVGADPWDKNIRNPVEWVEYLKEHLDDNSSFVWTSIPDWVTKKLQELGYDGITDQGGKMGGQKHAVWVPFEPGQVKSPFNRGTWNPKSKDVRYSPDSESARDEENQRKAEEYFSLGHADESNADKVWRWQGGQLQTGPGHQTHGSLWRHSQDRFKGRYDASKNIITFVDERGEVKSEDQLPQQVYKALKSKFPKDAPIKFFSPDARKADAPNTQKGLDALAEKHKDRVRASAHMRDKYVYLQDLAAKKGAAIGSGSAYMEDLVRFADAHGLTITLQTASRGDLGNSEYKRTTSGARLKKFYGRFGFKSNYGKRSYRADLPGNMHREPVKKDVDTRQFSPEGAAVKYVAPTKDLKSEPGYVYHASNAERVHDIAASGSLKTFRPNYGTEQDAWPDGKVERRSYWSKNAGIVADFAPEDGHAVVLRVKRTDAFRDESTGDVYATKPVKIGDIEILTEDGWKPLKAD